MLNTWFYSHSVWAVAALVCSFLIAVSLVGLYFFTKMVDWQKREHDTSMVGLSYALCGGIYAVVLAFMAVGTYEAMEKTTAIASSEADSLGSISFDSAGLPPELGEKVREDVDGYIDIVTKKEWKSQQNYQMDEKNFAEGWKQATKINADVANFEPATPGQATIKVDIMHVVNDLFASRRARLLAATSHLPDAVWQMLVIGLLLVVFYVYLFGPHKYWIHVAVTTFTMLTIGLVFTLVISLDYPFRGDLSVDDEAFLGVKEVAEKAFPHAEGAEHGAAEHGAEHGKEGAGEHGKAAEHKKEEGAVEPHSAEAKEKK